MDFYKPFNRSFTRPRERTVYSQEVRGAPLLPVVRCILLPLWVQLWLSTSPLRERTWEVLQLPQRWGPGWEHSILPLVF